MVSFTVTGNERTPFNFLYPICIVPPFEVGGAKQSIAWSGIEPKPNTNSPYVVKIPLPLKAEWQKALHECNAKIQPLALLSGHRWRSAAWVRNVQWVLNHYVPAKAPIGTSGGKKKNTKKNQVATSKKGNAQRKGPHKPLTWGPSKLKKDVTSDEDAEDESDDADE